MSTSWSAPDPRRAAVAAPASGVAASGVAAFGVAVDETATERVPVGEEVRAGLIAAVVPLLVAAPVGLLWAAVAPRVDVVVSGDRVDLAESGSTAFIAGDGFFLLAVALAGVVSGLVAWRLARQPGPGVVLGLALGGLAAAYVAMVVGQQVGSDAVQAAIDGGLQGALEINLRLRAREALVGWPVGALVAFVGASLVRRRPVRSG